MKDGSRAPNFILPDANGKDFALGDSRGQWVLLNFYPRDFAPVCTKQACLFRDSYDFLPIPAVVCMACVREDPAEIQDF